MKKERKSENFRKTSETEIFCKVNIDGKGLSNINTPIPFSTAFAFSMNRNIIPPANTMKIISTAALKPNGMAVNISNIFIEVEGIVLYEFGTTVLRPFN